MPPPVVATRTARGIADEPSGPVGIGADYKAHFTAGAVTFTPALGEAAPHNLPLRWTMLDARRGELLVHGADPTVSPRHAGDAVLFERGNVTERYDVLAEGLKQSFVFAKPLPGNGDLVVRGRIECESSPEVAADGSWSWSMPGVGGVRIHAVVGIDADGRRVGGSMRVVASVLELVLPADFVDSARYPLTLDPLLGTQALYSVGQDAIECDVGVNSFFANMYYVVWSRRYSALDSDVYGARASLLGPGSSLVAFDTSSALARRPRVGAWNFLQEFLVVWQQAPSQLAVRDVLGAKTTRTFTPTGLVEGKTANVTIAGTVDDEFNAEVAWEYSSSATLAVLFSDSTGIRAQGVGTGLAAGAPPTLTGNTVTIASGANVGDAAISRAPDSLGRRLLAYRFPGPISDDVAVRVIDSGLNLLGPVLTLGSSFVDEGHPAVDGAMVAWERRESPVAGARLDVVCATVTISGAGPVLATPPTVLAGTPGVDEFRPSVARLGTRHCVAYARNVGPLDDDIEAWLVNDDCTTCNSQIVLSGIGSGSFVREAAPRMASFAPPGVSPLLTNELLLVFTEASNTPPFTSQIVGQRVLEFADAPNPVNVGGACGLGGTAAATGESAIGNSAFGFTLSGADPAGLHLLSIGLPSLGLPCGPCVLTDFISLTFAGSGGTATSTFAIPCAPSLFNFQFEAQWLSAFSTVTPCPLVAGLSASDRLLITVGH